MCSTNFARGPGFPNTRSLSSPPSRLVLPSPTIVFRSDPVCAPRLSASSTKAALPLSAICSVPGLVTRGLACSLSPRRGPSSRRATRLCGHGRLVRSSVLGIPCSTLLTKYTEINSYSENFPSSRVSKPMGSNRCPCPRQWEWLSVISS